ncbi:MAG: sucrase ferredoxin [Actinomycetota bacterium]
MASRCSATSRELREALLGTASTVVNWLLVEQPGAWGRSAMEHSRLPEPVAAHLRRQSGVRVVLIRRHGRHVPDGIQVYAAHAGRRRRWLEHAHLPGPEALLEVDLSPLRQGRPLGIGTEQREPLYLVCTHGRHDPCCSERGRPVAGILERRFGDRVWEVSHIGGDRFAPNVVCLPAGVYLGRVDPEEAVGVIERFEDGRIDLAHYRGRCAYDFPTQAAETFLRERLGADGLDEVVLERRRRFAEGGVEAVFRTPDGLQTLRVTVDHPGPPRPITCRTPEAVPPVYRVEG